MLAGLIVLAVVVVFLLVVLGYRRQYGLAGVHGGRGALRPLPP